MPGTPPRWVREQSHASHASVSPQQRPQARESPTILRPPPIAASMVHSASLPRRPRSMQTTTSRVPADSSNLDSLLRQQHSLEQDLRTLLDAQADALLAGLSGPANPASSTTTTSATSSPSIPARDIFPTSSALLTATTAGKARPVRQPPPAGPLSLRAARRGIWDAMRALSSLKTAESSVLSASLASTTSNLTQIDTWKTKRAGLRSSIAAMLQDDAEGDGARARKLHDEQGALDEQIGALERQLDELRSQKRAVGLELREVDNRVQARLSSFRGALGEVERDVEHFVRIQRPAAETRRRQGVAGDVSRNGSIRLDESDAQQQLLADMQADGVAERDELEVRLHAAEVERQALEEGAVVWNDAVGEIVNFERTIAREIRKLARTDADGGGGGEASTGMDEHAQELASSEDLVSLLDDTFALVESKLRLAETNGWNLLVAAIGAELDALQQGRDLLFGSTAGSTRSASPAVERGIGAVHEDTCDTAGASKSRNDGEQIVRHGEIGKSTAGDDSRLVSPNRQQRPHQEDPDPDLLISG